jgi:hypothetical protein
LATNCSDGAFATNALKSVDRRSTVTVALVSSNVSRSIDDVALVALDSMQVAAATVADAVVADVAVDDFEIVKHNWLATFAHVTPVEVACNVAASTVAETSVVAVEEVVEADDAESVDDPLRIALRWLHSTVRCRTQECPHEIAPS